MSGLSVLRKNMYVIETSERLGDIFMEMLALNYVLSVAMMV